MRISHSLCRLVLGTALLVPVLSHAQSSESVYLADLAKSNKQVAQQYQNLMQDVAKRASWVKEFGTASPGETVSLDGRHYQVFQGCKPHDCTSSSYVVLLDAQAQTLSYGAFVENKESGPGWSSSQIQWLGNPELDQIRLMSPALF
ncbi:Ivy family c-type lysozyme inhibitor [Alcaligenes aquatilis]|uniref:Ivy family c-type lysozyme inhibitor n=1 Tax=Alcaligenes aquatilis TaxID=323284 RepID=UPI000D52E3DB|nr:Ivy family c-type lysozyme inhibitor [Alcaligenes aquatilis]AWG35760.1 C-lysozyme inhibitor [Alcaligenes aquatilis]